MNQPDLSLATRFLVMIYFDDPDQQGWEIERMRRDLLERRIWALTSNEEGTYTFWCQMTLEDAFALGLHRTMTGQFRRSLIREYPGIPENQLGRRVFELETEFLEAGGYVGGIGSNFQPDRKAYMRSEDVTLDTRFPAGTIFGNLPENTPLIQQYRDQLERYGIAVQVAEEGEDIVLSYNISVAEALAIGYNRHAPDELKFALLDAYPELMIDEARLEQRIRELEQRFRQRKAS